MRQQKLINSIYQLLLLFSFAVIMIIPSKAAFAQEEEEDQCAICLGVNENAQKVSLECGHTYDQSCIKEWIRVNSSCPTCRAPVSALKSMQINAVNVPQLANRNKYLVALKLASGILGTAAVNWVMPELRNYHPLLQSIPYILTSSTADYLLREFPACRANVGPVTNLEVIMDLALYGLLFPQYLLN